MAYQNGDFERNISLGCNPKFNISLNSSIIDKINNIEIISK